ncbi:tRNA preQ1(34) S-adenosylmethionine ribosyltransferase-isomerase QueA [Acuticoccus sp. MNP-M23]|uniref:tRNA preQ1(34) S-adenosylmethionine ribosyltransferase-isomerase QueA n=1 Tax=Acuticoccus sp. MNP-M23 TaxID=3072793 RepID=UPI002815F692|nr:tRNA preQ1(34) S-adenosylmethionine ribosyltransferase-isomerase QueA [Acuticoccus sp. MNP-M23]WMS40980.1 tRNA preQ1(34) S-adenosylmethionine ribosyltransferase-isomerase QueA [Acuticoccus sp. MNP-M23]
MTETTIETGPPGARLSDYDFELPESQIALRPAVPRDSARLLVHTPGTPLADARVHDLPNFLRPGDRLVVNDSRVIPAQLTGSRIRDEGTAGIALTLIENRGDGRWHAFAKPAKRVRTGDRLSFAAPGGAVEGVVETREGPSVTVAFTGDPLTAGGMPLPPYIAARRAADARDTDDYQTVYAAPPGSVAAPTAGLHFTPGLLETLANAGIAMTRLTLHVGPGTFLPVSADTMDGHKMHAEWGEISAASVAEIAATKAAGGRIVAVGTTALRLLESAAAGGTLKSFSDETALFIRPPHTFRVADGLMTNFHLPRSTLLMLVAAFIGYPAMRRVYDHALGEGYRFYSYGDSSLLWRT